MKLQVLFGATMFTKLYGLQIRSWLPTVTQVESAAKESVHVQMHALIGTEWMHAQHVQVR